MTDDTIPVRLSHLIWECSVGAIVRGPECLVTVKDTGKWQGIEQDEIQYVEHVRRVLGIVKKLHKPPVGRIEDNGQVSGNLIPAMRFPGWTSCNRCGLMYHRPWKRSRHFDTGMDGVTQTTWVYCSAKSTSKKGNVLNPPRCGGKLEQVPWVFVHKLGYMDEVPWHDLAHYNAKNPKQKACRRDWKESYLKIVLGSRGLASQVRCKRCKAVGEIESRFPLRSFMKQQPWIDTPPVASDELGWIVTVSDVRVHSSQTKSALVIPPESRIRRGSAVDRLFCNTRLQSNFRSAKTALQRKSNLNVIADKLGCSYEEIRAAMKEIDAGYPIYDESLPSVGEPLQAEYKALAGAIPDVFEGEDFVTEHHSEEWTELCLSLDGPAADIASTVDKLIAVKRLKEIVVLEGFRRCGSEGVTTPPDLTDETPWLPAVELYGEGIFLTLREDIIRRWEKDVDRYRLARIFNKRYTDARISLPFEPQVSPRFLLLHTLSHLIIRELETRAGYPTASMKERIYSATESDPDTTPMSGILIYIAVPDTEGSLGGLEQLAKPDVFLRILTSAVETSQWCSFDPVCRERDSHGPSQLNRAACHACVLVPEPTCVYNNMLLDRTFVTCAGPKHGIGGFFDLVSGPDT